MATNYSYVKIKVTFKENYAEFKVGKLNEKKRTETGEDY